MKHSIVWSVRKKCPAGLWRANGSYRCFHKIMNKVPLDFNVSIMRVEWGFVVSSLTPWRLLQTIPKHKNICRRNERRIIQSLLSGLKEKLSDGSQGLRLTLGHAHSVISPLAWEDKFEAPTSLKRKNFFFWVYCCKIFIVHLTFCCGSWA